LSGARIVRIATHPDAQRMGYGARALKLLIGHFEGRPEGGGAASVGVGGDGEGEREEREESEEEGEEGDEEQQDHALLKERVSPRKELPPLLTPLGSRRAARLHWIGASFGLTDPLLSFWARAGFRLVYLRQVRVA
jgi:N-acetyltransferase 10